MAIQPGVWGIDIGQCALKAIRLQEVDGEVQATAFDYVEHPKILSQPDADPDQLTHEALAKFLSRNTLRGDMVVISVPGQSGLARFVKLPPVEEKKISDIVRFEAKQQIPFNLDEVVWDYQKIGQGMVTDGFAMETEIGLFAMKRDMVNRYLGHFRDVHVEVHVVQMAPLALCNFVAYDLLGKGAPEAPAEGEEEGGGEDKHTCIVALDIGADSSNLIITDGDKIIWQRPIPLGGNHFTRALTKDLKLTFAKAEHLKRNATKSPDLKKILASLKPVLNDFVSEVQRSLAFFTNTHRDAQIEYMIGLGNAFRLPGLQRFLAEKLQLDVRKLNKMERMGGDTVVTQQAYTENILSFGVAYGLALQGLKRSRLVTNLLPSEIRIERLVKAKKPWAVAAAGALLLGGAMFLLSYYLDDRPYSDKSVTDAIKDSEGAVKRATDSKNKFTKAKDAALKEEEAVKSIVAGQMERKNWLALLKFIQDAVPKPDGSNLTAEMIHDYMDAQPKEETRPVDFKHGATTGRMAWSLYQKRLKGEGTAGKDEVGDELGEGINDLVQVNVEGIDFRYCDNLADFWAAARAESGDNEKDAREKWRPKEQYNEKPDGRAWIVELRGYTFHHDGREFLMNTLLENLARMGIRPDLGPPAQAAPAAAPGAKPAGSPPAPAPALAAGAKPPPAPAKPAGGPPAAAAPASPPANPQANALTADTLSLLVRSGSTQSPAAGPAPSLLALAQAVAPAQRSKTQEGDPVINRVSHFVLVKTARADTTATNAFMTITNPLAPTLIAGGGRAASAPAGGAGERAGPGGGGMQVRVAQRGGGGAGGGSSPRGGGGGPGAGWSSLSSEALGGTQASGTKEGSAPSLHTRTEFVIVFIWREPTPSDALRGMAPAATPAAPPAPGAKR